MQKLKFLRFSKEKVSLFLAVYIGLFLNLSVYMFTLAVMAHRILTTPSLKVYIYWVKLQ